MRQIILGPLLVAGLIWSQWVHAELLLSAAPRESAEAGARVYGPLAEELSAIMGEKVTYVHPQNWAAYSNAIRNDKYDFVFDGPHFASWRMIHAGHRPLARLPGSLSFYVVTRKGDGAPETLQDLEMQPVCAISSPNMMASVLLAQFGPVRAPSLVAIKGGLGNVYKALNEGRCVAAVFRFEFVEKLPDAERDALQIVFRSRVYPNQSITVSNRVDISKHEALIAALTRGDAAYTAPLRERFGTPGMNGAFIPVRPNEFEGLNNLLEGVVWGW